MGWMKIKMKKRQKHLMPSGGLPMSGTSYDAQGYSFFTLELFLNIGYQCLKKCRLKPVRKYRINGDHNGSASRLQIYFCGLIRLKSRYN